MARWLPSLTAALFCLLVACFGGWWFGLTEVQMLVGPAHSTARAQPPSAAQRSAADAQARRLLARANGTLARRRSVSANLSQTIRLYGKELIARGSYLQGPTSSRWLSLDLKIKTEPSDAFVQQRCDGQSLWTLRTVDGLPTLTKVDVPRVAERRATQSGMPLPTVGVGGLVELLSGLERCFEYDAVNEAKLTRGPETLQVYALSGRWRPAMLVHWLPDQRTAIESGQPADLTRLPPMLPDRVFVLLGRDDLFLYRVEYVRETAGRKSRADAGPFVSLNLDQVEFDRPVDARQFVFERGAVPAADATDAYLSRLSPTPH